MRRNFGIRLHASARSCLRRNEDWTGMMRTSLRRPRHAGGNEKTRRAGRHSCARSSQRFRCGGAAGARGLSPAFCRGAEGTRRLQAGCDHHVRRNDQYENFKEDVVRPSPSWPMTSTRSSREERAWNPWGEPNDRHFSFKGHRACRQIPWHSGCSRTASTRLMRTSRCTTRSAMPSRTRCCCSTTSGVGLATRSYRSR